MKTKRKSNDSLPPQDFDPDATDRLPVLEASDEDLEATGAWAEGERPGSGDEAERTQVMQQPPQQAEAAVPTIEDAIADLNRVLREKSTTISRLERELARARAAGARDAERESMEQRLQEVERERVGLAATLDEQRVAFARMEDCLSAAEESRRDAEFERDRLRKGLAAAEAAREQAVALADEVSVELEELSRITGREEHERERQQLRERISELRNALTVAREELAELKAPGEHGAVEFAELRAELVRRDRQIESLLERLRTGEALRRYQADFRASDRAGRPAATMLQSDPDRRIENLERLVAVERRLRTRAEQALEALRSRSAPDSGEEADGAAASDPAAAGDDPGTDDAVPAGLAVRVSELTAELSRREDRISVLEAELRRQSEVLDRIRQGLGMPATSEVEEAHGRAKPRRDKSARLRRYLTRLDGDSPVSHVVSKARIAIGRTPDNDLQVRETYISRHHATLLIGPDSAILEDAGSSNGVFLNDRRVRREVLRDGDVIGLGKARFRFQVREPDAATG